MRASAEDIRQFNEAFTKALEEFYFSARYLQESMSKNMNKMDVEDAYHGTAFDKLGEEAFLFHMKGYYDQEADAFNAIRNANDIINNIE